MKEKLISVIIPIYNVEKHLDKCIESIINQTYKNLEIILVDDGSPDRCPEMCDEWAKKDARIIVLHKTNGGLSDARNSGFSIASGEYISFIDSDDYIEKDFYKILANELDKGADVAECATRLCDEKDNTLSVRGFKESKILDTVSVVQTLLKEKGIYQTVWNKVYKRNCIKDVLFEYGKYHEDNFWTWQIFLKAKSVSVVNEPMYNYVQRASGIMGAGYSVKRLDALEADYIVFNALKNCDDYSSAVANRFVRSCLYQLQSALKYLNKKEQKNVINSIMDFYVKSGVKTYKSIINNKWYKMFLINPMITAKIRNIIGIGF